MQKRVMEEDFRKGEGRPQLLHLIPNERDWMVKEVGGGGKCFGVSKEKKLELRLGLPGGEDWSAVNDKREEHPVEPALSLGHYSKVSKTTGSNPSSVGAKRGFLDTVESKTEVFQQQQQHQPGFLQLQAKGKELSQKTNGRAEQQSLEKKASGSPVAHGSAAAPCGDAAGANNSSQTRTATTPVVGWPPIRSFRRNLASTSKPSLESWNGGSETAVKFENGRKGLFVKINMDGIPIGRKVDLKAYDSYEKLALAVDELFQGLLAAQRDPLTAGIQKNPEEKQAITGLLDGSGEYTLVYEDDEGDTMLVGDVPWGMFVSTAKRLRVLKSSELSATSLGAVSRKRTAT
ncbi:auxin-responsive protein IAA16-like isoform X2 [Phoenix dactylifera]|uniref:Auxin-responsive protein n=1 Tax=Phoenix dactylifera TaxID=42345 RepID=A0A8B7C0V6_PHODC|nr:auxin-responsive protein IAA16-like isoform X2 [Phoenix dactylifera]